MYSFSSSISWTSLNPYLQVLQYRQAEIRIDGRLKNATAFFADAELGEICSTGQRVLVKKAAHKTVRVVITKRTPSNSNHRSEIRMWGYGGNYGISNSCYSLSPNTLSRHANLPHLIGCSKTQSNTQFILFYDDMSCAASRTSQLRSLAAFVLDTFRTQDVFSIIDMLVDFVSVFWNHRKSED